MCVYVYNVVVYGCLTMSIFFHYIASYHFEFMYICCIYIVHILSVGELVAGKVNVLLLLLSLFMMLMMSYSLRLLVLFALCILHKHEMQFQDSHIFCAIHKQFFINDIRNSLRILLLVFDVRVMFRFFSSFLFILYIIFYTH